MNKKRLKKEPGLRWVENQGSVHYFSFGYASNPDIKIIHGMIEWFNIKSKGKVMFLILMLFYLMWTMIKRYASYSYIVRLVLAFALVRMPP